MPRFDGTGPNGKGIATGRGLGRCEYKKQEDSSKHNIKLFITADSDNLNSKMDLRFGRTKFFHVYNLQKKETEVVKNPGYDIKTRAGLETVDFIIKNNADILITGHVGPNARKVLEESNIEVFESEVKEIPKIIEEFIKSNIKN